MSASDVIDTGVRMARLARVIVVAPGRVQVEWNAGSRAGIRETLDLSPLLGSYKIYARLRHDPELFATARLIEDGDAIAWDGEDLEMSADMVESLAEQEMSPADFARFLKRNDLTQEAAAALLGRSRRQVGYYLSRGPIPRVVALACIGYESSRQTGHNVA